MLNEKILTSEVQHFIQENLTTDISKIALKKSPFEGVSSHELAEQISAKIKCKNKLPLWFASKGIYFPPKLSIEQASSEQTALYKSQLVSGKLLDMTGGFGVDDYYFQQKCQKVVYCELNPLLSQIVAHNFSVLGANAVECFLGNSFDYLTNTQQRFNFIYLDPVRRDNHQNKVFLLKDCTPNVPDSLEFLWNFTEVILIKTSPMLDIQSAIQELSNVKEIHIVAVNNEVKELIFLLKKSEINNDILIKSISISSTENQEFSFYISEKQLSEEVYDSPKKFLYEPNAAIMKSGGFSVLGTKYNLKKLAKHSHLFTSQELVCDFQGRIFEIESVEEFHKSIKQKVENQKFNITTRHFPLSVAEIRKKFKIKDGGDKFLFFTTDFSGQKITIFCKKII